MKKSIKFFSLFLALIMVFSILPLSAGAAETTPEEETAEEEIKGECGNALKWIFDEKHGTLTISGKGAMDDYTENTQPWSAYRPNILRIVVGDGVTSIGNYAFFNCPDLEEVQLGSSLKRIGDDAFSDCNELYSLKLPVGLKEIGVAAFNNCKLLYFVEIPDGIEVISESAFWGCETLYAVILPDTVSKVEKHAFQWCESLEYVYYAGNKAEWGSVVIEENNECLTRNGIIFDFCEHRYIELHKGVPANCKETGYTNGLYCAECEAYLFGHDVIPVDKTNHDWVAKCEYKEATCVKEGFATFVCSRDKLHIKTMKSEIDPTNHKNTEHSDAVAPSADNLGYTEGEYCKDCKTYISGHEIIPLKAINFIDSDVAFLSGTNVITVKNTKLDTILSYTDAQSYATDLSENVIVVNDIAETGMILVTSKNRRAYVAVLGDTDGNGIITAADARMALRISVRLDKFAEGDAVLAAADVNGDGAVSAKDARTILRASIELDTIKLSDAKAE